MGQERLKHALILNAINPRIGGVLIRGEKGTAKSTAVRGLARLLPTIQVVPGCPYRCSPDSPAHLCPVCADQQRAGAPLPVVAVPTPLVELPVSASEDRVVGALDLEYAITEGQRRFEPGLLAQVNRGLLYVDEVNLLDDHLVDLLLDAAAMGVNTVEREGISVSHPARFILVGTMNPEEGELRPQLLDRFGLAVEVRGIDTIDGRVAVIERRIAYEHDPDAFVARWQNEDSAIARRIVAARACLPDVRLSRSAMAVAARIALDMGVDGHRADLTILETARTHAAWCGRTRLNADDFQLAAELALPHRLRRQPFVEPGDQTERINAALQRSVVHIAADDDSDKDPDPSSGNGDLKKNDPTPLSDAEWDRSESMSTNPPTSATRPASSSSDQPTPMLHTDMLGDLFRPQRLEGRNDHLLHRSGGRRTPARTERKQGRYITSQRVPHVTDLALDATLRVAAPFQRQRRSQHDARLILRRSDLRQKVRVRRTRNAVCFVLDASWSMAAEERMQATRSAVFSLLRDAYQRRDYVGVVTFQRTYATVLLPLTNSVERAHACLHTMPIGGKTPLARGLLTGFELLQRACQQNQDVIPLLVVITDGQANVAMGSASPQQETERIARHIAASQMRAIVIDTESSAAETYAPSTITSAHASRAVLHAMSSIERGLAHRLARNLNGHYYQLEELKEGGLARMVRSRLDYR